MKFIDAILSECVLPVKRVYGKAILRSSSLFVEHQIRTYLDCGDISMYHSVFVRSQKQ